MPCWLSANFPSGISEIFRVLHFQFFLLVKFCFLVPMIDYVAMMMMMLYLCLDIWNCLWLICTRLSNQCYHFIWLLPKRCWLPFQCTLALANLISFLLLFICNTFCSLSMSQKISLHVLCTHTVPSCNAECSVYLATILMLKLDSSTSPGNNQLHVVQKFIDEHELKFVPHGSRFRLSGVNISDLDSFKHNSKPMYLSGGKEKKGAQI